MSEAFNFKGQIPKLKDGKSKTACLIQCMQ